MITIVLRSRVLNRLWLSGFGVFLCTVAQADVDSSAIKSCMINEKKRKQVKTSNIRDYPLLYRKTRSGRVLIKVVAL